MAADIVNLRGVRKAKAKRDREAGAEENRRLHGRTKAERDREADARRRLDRHLAGHKREPDDGTA